MGAGAPGFSGDECRRHILHDDPVRATPEPPTATRSSSSAGAARSASRSPGGWSPPARGTSSSPRGAPTTCDDEVQVLRDAGATTVDTVEFDADDLAGHADVLAEVERRHGLPGTTLVAFGVLGDQATAEQDPAAAVAVVHTDYVAQVHVLTLLARRYREAGRGRIVVFSSVAGVAGPPGELRVRLGQGRARRLRQRARRRARRHRACGCCWSGPGFVVGRMTRGDVAGAAVQHARTPSPTRSSPRWPATARSSGCRGPSGGSSALMRITPRALWRRLPR